MVRQFRVIARSILDPLVVATVLMHRSRSR
jgi:hypothetical protein